jgi:lambda family phage tail tape measure protein
MGEELFTNSMSIMSSAISDFVKTGQLDFAKLAQSFAAMLADMALKWAAASIVRSLLGDTSGPGTVSPFAVGGGPQGPSGGAVAATGVGWFAQAFSWLGSLVGGGMAADGADVLPGRSYIVGERGPETFVPRAAGTIVPNGAAQSSVTVNVDMGTTAGASDPAAALAFGRKIKAAVVDVIHNEKRPGGSLYQRMTA